MKTITNTPRSAALFLVLAAGVAFASAALAQSSDKPATAPAAAPAAAPGTQPITITPVSGPPPAVRAAQPGAAQPGQPGQPGAAGAAQPGQPAQPKPFQLPERMQPPPPPPPFVKPAIPAHKATDSDVLAVTRLISGSFKAAAAGDQPARVLHGATIAVEGLDNATYFEITREDSPMTAYRQGIWHVYKQSLPGGEQTLVLRVFDFDKFGTGFGQSVTGLWLVPEYFPAVKLDQLRAIQDIPLKKTGDAFEGTSSLTPTVIGGATIFTSAIKLDKAGVSWQDKGFDAAGKQVFGAAAPDAFAPYTPAIKFTKNDETGLVVIDLREGAAAEAPAADGSELYIHYTGWTAADGNSFDSSRERDPLKMMLPGQLIAGWNVGMPGIKLGGYRKLVIPGGLGYGTRGNPRAKIPPMATLIFETECVFHKLPEKGTEAGKQLEAKPLANPAEIAK